MDNLMLRGAFGTLCSRSAAASSYLPILRTICRLEQLKEQDKVKRRYKHSLVTSGTIFHCVSQCGCSRVCRNRALEFSNCAVPCRFLHYLDSIHLGLEKSLLQRLADDFP